jgi:hypothetical protein
MHHEAAGMPETRGRLESQLYHRMRLRALMARAVPEAYPYAERSQAWTRDGERHELPESRLKPNHKIQPRHWAGVAAAALREPAWRQEDCL